MGLIYLPTFISLNFRGFHVIIGKISVVWIHNGNILSRWWFYRLFMFTPKIGEDFQFDSYFSDGLVQPPIKKWWIFLQKTPWLDENQSTSTPKAPGLAVPCWSSRLAPTTGNVKGSLLLEVAALLRRWERMVLGGIAPEPLWEKCGEAYI